MTYSYIIIYYMYIATYMHVDKGSFWWGYWEMDHSYCTNGSICKCNFLESTLSNYIWNGSNIHSYWPHDSRKHTKDALIRILRILSIIYNTENNIVLYPIEASLLSEYS